LRKTSCSSFCCCAFHFGPWRFVSPWIWDEVVSLDVGSDVKTRRSAVSGHRLRQVDSGFPFVLANFFALDSWCLPLKLGLDTSGTVVPRLCLRCETRRSPTQNQVFICAFHFSSWLRFESLLALAPAFHRVCAVLGIWYLGYCYRLVTSLGWESVRDCVSALQM
jgi:hypothetical protein